MTIDTSRDANPLQIVTWWRAMRAGGEQALRPISRDQVILYQAVTSPPVAVLGKDLDATIALLESLLAERSAKRAALLSPAGRDGDASQPPATPETTGN